MSQLLNKTVFLFVYHFLWGHC